MNEDEALKAYNYGMQAARRGNTDQAKKYFEKSIKLNKTKEAII